MDDEVRMDDIRGMVLFVPGLQSLIDVLRERGWAVIAPTCLLYTSDAADE